MFGLPLLYWGLWLAILILWMGRFVISFMSIYLVSELHVDAGTAGSVVAMYGFGGIFGCLFGGALSDRFGREPMIVAGELGSAAMLVVLSFIDDPAVMGATLLVYGAISSIPTPAIAAYIADVVPVRNQKRAYTLQTWAVNFGFAIGPIIANQLIRFSYELMFYAEAAVLVAVTVMLVAFFHRMGVDRTDHGALRTGSVTDAADGPSPAAPNVSMAANYRRALTDWPLMSMVLLMFGYTVAYFQMTSGLPIAMTEIGLGTNEYSMVLTINGAILCLLQIPAIAVFNRMSNTRVLILGMLMTAVGYAFQIGANSWHGFVAAAVLWTLGELGTFPIAATTVASLAPADARGTYQGVYNLVWSMSQGMAPLIGGWVLANMGARFLWEACTAMFLLVALGLRLTKSARERAVARNLAGLV
ncbi:MDR family MFS transporter [Bifidobacterium avesanii]|uniref:MFS transporter n=1 Tax=Bifidobacterium avesanii TaxID=1798157 RepID=A0A7K3TEB0_9BIFI|nr:MFS transporter [Bifidobacterium avesanii]KAB8295431.1 permease [Bifidobacterium avesanii]NEG77437.1 MFS transporter [Bifidobacterium avesanii]